MVLSYFFKEVAFCVLMDKRGGLADLHFLPLHGLVISTCFAVKKNEVPIYAWGFDNVSGEAPLSVWFNPYWILVSYDRVAVNKMSAIDQAVQYKELGVACIELDRYLSTEKVGAPKVVYIPSCLLPSVLAEICLPRIS